MFFRIFSLVILEKKIGLVGINGYYYMTFDFFTEVFRQDGGSYPIIAYTVKIDTFAWIKVNMLIRIIKI